MATTRERAQAAREAKLDELHKRLTGAVEHLVSGEDWSRALAFAAQFRARSFSNTLLIWDQHQGAYEQGRVPGRSRRMWPATSSGRHSAGRWRRASPAIRFSLP